MRGFQPPPYQPKEMFKYLFLSFVLNHRGDILIIRNKTGAREMAQRTLAAKLDGPHGRGEPASHTSSSLTSQHALTLAF